MKKVIVMALAAFCCVYTAEVRNVRAANTFAAYAETGSIDIKIKNDTDNEVRVYNAGSGGSYSLTKGATTTIKMDEGDKLYYYENGKKGALILTASSDMDGKVQLLSKL